MPGSSDVPTRGPIALYLSALTIGGRERLIFDVARELMRRGQDVDVVTVGADDAWVEHVPDRARLVNLLPSSARALRGKNIARLILAVPALAAYLNRSRPRALLAVSIPPNLTALVARHLSGADTRLVLRQSNVVHVSGIPQYAAVRRRWRDPLIRRLYPAADGFIAVSRGVADNLRHLLPPGSDHSVRVIANHVITDSFAARAAEPLDHPWLVDATTPCVVAVGRLVPKKDYPTLLEAFTRLRRERPVKLLILGEGPERHRLSSLIDDLDLNEDVELAGHVSNPLPYLSRADLYVLSSISEGMPSALVEALACGASVVSTDCPSGPAEILEGGRCGRLVQVGDPAALAAAMADGLDAPPARADLTARAEHFRARHGVDAYVETLLAAAAEPVSADSS